MNSKAQLGNDGEDAATDYLTSKGYQLLERNYRYKRSEIDIICQQGDVLVFIEVKAKSYTAFGEPEASVDERKAAKVIEGAEQYLHEKDWRGDIRFDVISLVKNGNDFVIKHFEDAFY